MGGKAKAEVVNNSQTVGRASSFPTSTANSTHIRQQCERGSEADRTGQGTHKKGCKPRNERGSWLNRKKGKGP